ncbi:MAG: Gfo/Idh/MocA family oxidoreductase [Porphyromonas sp.]|nr:Gfo/Idh/MocA family oxidoreductase [Porphyromonas sp.]
MNRNHVLSLRCAPIPIVRIAIIGLGIRGTKALARLVEIPGVEIVALADLDEEAVRKASALLPHQKVDYHTGTDAAFSCIEHTSADLLYITTTWESHATIATEGMKHGKHVAVEVPAAISIPEIWQLIETAEQTRKHCFMLENSVYDSFELSMLNMAQSGLFGEIIHAKGGYVHNLHSQWLQHREDWRLAHNIARRGDLYPTHGIAPLCLAMNIHRGDRLFRLVSMDASPKHTPQVLSSHYGEDFSRFANGDHTQTIIQTAKGRTLYIEHDVASYRPYSRSLQIVGTDGFAQKYPYPTLSLKPEYCEGISYSSTLHPELPDYLPSDKTEVVLQKYAHPILTPDIVEGIKHLKGHAPMSGIMDRRLIYCLQKGLPLDMDVYDMAEWCSIIPLSEESLRLGSVPIEIPDFTRGAWEILEKVDWHIS